MRNLNHFFSHHYADLACIGLLWLLILMLTPMLGLWEPWESNFAQVVEQMRQNGSWMVVQMPQGTGAHQNISNLAFAYWPAVATTAIFGFGEFGLRLPSLLILLPVLLLFYHVTRRYFDRIAAICCVLVLCALPLFVYPMRLAFTQSFGLGTLTLSCLAILLLFADEAPKKRWQWLGWAMWAIASLCTGLVGFLTPLATALVALIARKRQEASAVRPLLKRLGFLPMGVALAVIALGAWRAAVHHPGHIASLFLWQDQLSGSFLAKNRPSFEAAVHQLGFGLFPFSALLPFAFIRLLGTSHTETPSNGHVAPALFAWFAIAFLAPACTISYSHTPLFLGAPAAALAVGLYIASILKSHREGGLREPIWALCTVAALALLDSTLKHDPHLLADCLVGKRVDEFPAAFPGFAVVRLFDMLLLGALLLYQGGADRVLKPVITWIFYPVRKLAAGYYAAIALVSLALPIYVTVRPPHSFDRLMQWSAWSKLVPQMRKVIIFIVLWIAILAILRMIWAFRVKKLDGRREGRIGQLYDRVIQFVMHPKTALFGTLGLVLLIALFQNAFVAKQLTTQFSQRDLLREYQRFASGSEKLYKYLVESDLGMYASRNLQELDPSYFKTLSQSNDRFFALIPRNKLARIHADFKRTTGRNLPVLYNDNLRVLLVSNQIKQGETDLNPINRALIQALPEKAHKTSIIFNQKLELAGWSIEPASPRPGSQAELTLYWRVLEPVSGQWKVFVHVDAPGQRINGDHDPVEGLFPTSNWTKGDLIQDTHRLLVQNSVTPASFTLYAGLFQGSKRMPISSGDKDNENRAKLGMIRVR